MKKIIFSTFLFFAISLSFVPNDLNAQDFGEEAKVKFQVDHVANIFEKLKEKITLFFKFSSEGKYNYQKYLVEKRMAELKYVVDSKGWQPVEETSSRYATYLGNFTDFIVKKKLINKKEDILKMYDRHNKILEELKKNFEFESGFWLLLQHDINSTKIFAEQVRNF